MQHLFLVDLFRDEREMYAEFLMASGFHVSTFDVPEAALNAATTLQPDAIVTRQEGGHISGIALTANLRADPATRDIPVVVITTSILARDRADAEVAGSDAYLLLPTTPDDLVKEVREVFLARALRKVSPRPIRSDSARPAERDEIV